MAGPTVSILLSAFTHDHLKNLEKFIRKISIGNTFEKEDDHWIFTPNHLYRERKKKEKDCSFLAATDTFGSLLEENEIDQIITKIGFLPVHEISFSAMCNKADDHIILGKLAHDVAEMLHGLIDMDGAICPPVENRGPLDEFPWCTIDEISNYVTKIKGKVIQIEYTTARQTKWCYHIVDREFFSNWMKHPDFHMIK